MLQINWKLIQCARTLRTEQQKSAQTEKEEHEAMRQILAKQPLPKSKAAFKNHPLYCLEEHITRYQYIHPRTPVGEFKGAPVFARSSLLELKSADKWVQYGRSVKDGELPLKTIFSVWRKGLFRQDTMHDVNGAY
jgi:hypothetical protein